MIIKAKGVSSDHSHKNKNHNLYMDIRSHGAVGGAA